MADISTMTGIQPKVREQMPDLDADELDRIDGLLADATELNLLDGLTAGTVTASKALVVDSSKDLASLRHLTLAGNVLVGGSVQDASGNDVIDSSGNADFLAVTGTTAELSSTVTASGAAAFGSTLHAVGNITSSGTIGIGSAVLAESEVELLDGITAGTGAPSKVVTLDACGDVDTIGAVGCGAITSSGSVHAVGNITSSGVFAIGAAQMSETDLELLDGITAGTAAVSKCLTLDACGDISGITDLSATTLTGSTSVTVGSGVIKVVKTTLTHDSSATATETALCTVPEDSMILDVAVKTIVAFDGSATTTCEVGINGNTDKYIDAADWDASVHNDTINMYGSTTSDTALPEFVSAAMAVVFTSTNTGTVGAGQIEGIVTYIELDFSAD